MEEKEGRKRRFTKRTLAVCLILAVCAGVLFYRNMPLQRQRRILKQADSLMESREYVQAEEEYALALGIRSDGEAGEETAARASLGRARAVLAQADALMEEQNYAQAEEKYARAFEVRADGPEGTRYAGLAAQGRIRAVLAQADQLQAGQDISEDTLACDLYRQALALCDGDYQSLVETAEDLPALREEAAQKLTGLRSEMAASFEAVACTSEKDDRSGTTVLPDGTKVPYVRYYDLVQVTEEYYPFADGINQILDRDRNAFFASAEDAAPGGGTASDQFRDYVGLGGIYSGNGLLCIRLAQVRTQGSARNVSYRGKTFRLSDGSEMTLADLTGRTDTGLRHLLRRRLSSWVEEGGYRNISRSEIEAYVEETAPEDFKFCIRDDGTACLVIDQDVPFFRGAGEAAEIPLETDL